MLKSRVLINGLRSDVGETQLRQAKESSGNFFVNGGNSFGAPAVLGTDDNQPLTVQSNGGTNHVILGDATHGILISNGVGLLGGAGTITVQSTNNIGITAGGSLSMQSTGGGLSVDASGAMLLGTTNATSVFISKNCSFTGANGAITQSAAFGAGNFGASIVNSSNVATAGALGLTGGQNTFSATTNILQISRPDGTVIGSGQQTASGAVTWQTSSDARMKTDVADLSVDALAVVREVRVRQFRYAGDAEDAPLHHGFIAQELESVYPEVVSPGTDETKPKVVDGREHETETVLAHPASVAYGHMTPLLARALQQLAERVDALEGKK